MKIKKSTIALILVIVLLISVGIIAKLVEKTKDETGKGYVDIKYGDKHKIYPLSINKNITIKQKDGAINVIHISKDGVYMVKSNCKGGDCLREGEITPQNIHTRALGNKIICLPHKLIVKVIQGKDSK